MDIKNFSRCINLTEDEARAYVYIPAKQALITIVVPIIAVFGIVANSSFLIVINRIPYMRTTTNFYLANLAVSDGLLLAVTSLRYMWTYFDSPAVDFKYGTPFHNSAGCVVPMLLTSSFNFTSVFFITWVALERYNAVCRPLLYGGKSGRIQAVKLTVLAWAVTLVYISPHSVAIALEDICFRWPFNYKTDHNPVRQMRKCKWSNWAIVSISLFDLGQFTIAFVANCIMYFKIVCQLSQRKEKERHMGRPFCHVSRMLTINASVFFACLAPYQLINVADVIEMFTEVNIYTRNTYNLFLWIGQVAFLLNSTVNPIIYNLSNPDYRHAFVTTFVCRDRPCSSKRYDKDTGVKNEMRQLDTPSAC